MLEFVLPDGSVIKAEKGISVKELAGRISERLARRAIGVLLDGEVYDVHTELTRGGKLKVITPEDPESLQILRHSCAHVLAKAVKRLFPEAKFGIGPATEEGFFYDIDVDGKLSEETLERIEEEMRKIISAKEPFVREKVSRERAKELFADDPYKLELISEIPEDEPIFVYWLGEDFCDLCKGPHLENAGQIKAFKLLSVSGAYWKGSEENKMLQRVHGTAFWKKSQLDEFLKLLEEAKKRDHRVLGKELELFAIYEESGPGLVFWLPKGSILRRELEKWIEEEHEKRGYQRVYTPHIMKIELWETSGHLGYYSENMFFVPVSEHGSPADVLSCKGKETYHWYAVKPMNCPAHILIYKSKVRSYRDLPIRFFELGTVYRYEKSGSLHGLLRVRGFTQDDGHIFCTPEQLKEEIEKVLDYVLEVMDIFKFDYVVNLGTKPDKYIGSDEDWEHAQDSLVQALESKGIKFNVVEGDGAFYGPKIDIAVLDALKRKWDGPTIQVDFNLPQRFELTYVDSDGKEKRPVMIHRAIMGSIERFIGLLIEHFGGLFPLWLAPVQVAVIPVSEKFEEYADAVAEVLAGKGVRVEVLKEGRVGYRIRKSEVLKIPYMLVVGEKEVNSGTVSVRSKKKGDLGTMNLNEFVEMIVNEIKEKTV
jgi:threonyl-tRNA synthetase